MLLEALALRVRLVEQRQVAEALWASHLANARRRLRRLVCEGMITREILPAMPLPELNEPVVRWQPGQATPHSDAISFQLQSRWRFLALRPTVVYFPTSMTVTYFGRRLLVGSCLVFAFVAVPVAIAIALVTLVAFSAISRGLQKSDTRPKVGEWQQITETIRSSKNPIERDSIYIGRVAHDGSPLLVPRAVFQEHAHLLGANRSSSNFHLETRR